MPRKNTYSLIVNRRPARGKLYRYTFKTTKDIEFVLAKDCFCVTADMTALKSHEQIVSSSEYLFRDALKKALLIHIIKYSKPMKIKNIYAEVNGDERMMFDANSGDEYISSTVEGALARKFPKEWDNDKFIKALLARPQSKYDKLDASLFALIYSKSKTNEIERFNYLWMSMNGIYDKFSEMVEKEFNANRSKKNKKNFQEIASIRCLSYLLGFGDEHIVDHNSRDHIAWGVRSVISKEWDGQPITEESMTSGCHAEMAQHIRERLVQRNNKGKSVEGLSHEYDLTPYGYLALHLPYYYRCRFFHSEKTMPLFTFKDDGDVRTITALNSIMEPIIESLLYHFYDDEYIQTYLMPKAAEAANNINWSFNTVDLPVDDK